MVRIGGKEMTRERDRIQENANKYIVKNCPAYYYLGEECHNKEGQYGVSCCEITNCIIKQVTDKCKDKIRIYEYYDKDYALGQVEYAKSILQLFDIEEINK